MEIFCIFKQVYSQVLGRNSVCLKWLADKCRNVMKYFNPFACSGQKWWHTHRYGEYSILKKKKEKEKKAHRLCGVDAIESKHDKCMKSHSNNLD